ASPVLYGVLPTTDLGRLAWLHGARLAERRKASRVDHYLGLAAILNDREDRVTCDDRGEHQAWGRAGCCPALSELPGALLIGGPGHSSPPTPTRSTDQPAWPSPRSGHSGCDQLSSAGSGNVCVVHQLT